MERTFFSRAFFCMHLAGEPASFVDVASIRAVWRIPWSSFTSLTDRIGRFSSCLCVPAGLIHITMGHYRFVPLIIQRSINKFLRHPLRLLATSRPWSSINCESVIISPALPSATIRPLSITTARLQSRAAKFILQVAITRV